MKFDTVEFIKKLVSFESVSADASKREEVRQCAEFYADTLRAEGFSADILPTNLNPIVFARRECKTREPKIKILCYGHYDVQPVDPIAKWKLPPFSATVKDGKIWGRGTADNKGPFACLFAGMSNFLRDNPEAPVEFGILLDGEEEIGSPSMIEFARTHASVIAKYDILLLSDTSAVSETQPILTIGLRGTGAFDAVFKGPNTDVHSGMFGGVVYNPIQAMTEVCASLHNADGLVNIPHFYDGLEKLEDWERAEIAKNPFGDEAVKKHLGVSALYSQKGYTASEALRVLPTVELTGIGGGYQGEGSKSVIASECFCKFCCRTVAPQKTREVLELVQKTMSERTPKGVEISFVNYDSGGDAYFLNPKKLGNGHRDCVMRRALAAVDDCSKKTFGNAPIMLREGASIPLISAIKNETGLDSLMFGLFTAEDNLHAPNEGFSLKTIANAVGYYEMFFSEMSKIS